MYFNNHVDFCIQKIYSSTLHKVVWDHESSMSRPGCGHPLGQKVKGLSGGVVDADLIGIPLMEN